MRKLTHRAAQASIAQTTFAPLNPPSKSISRIFYSHRNFSISLFCRKVLFSILGVAFFITSWARAADKLTVVPVEPVAAEPVDWDGKKGETIDGKKFSAAVSIKLVNCSDITISCCDLHSITLGLCDHVTIRNCWIHDCGDISLNLWKANHVRIEGCRIENVLSGVFAAECESVQFVGNFCRNLKGPFPRGQMIQLDKVKGAGNLIQGNYAINEKGKSFPEDVINLYKSHGEEKSPIIVEDNYLVGDLKEGSEGKSKTGSGIMTADAGGSWQVCRRNVVLSAGQCGIGVAGGTHIRVEDNFIRGLKSTVSNQGLYVWNQSGQPSDDVSVLRNRVHWITAKGDEASWWDGGGITHVVEKDNHFADETIATSIPPPPSEAPMPPHPWTTPGPDNVKVARLPWKTNSK